MPFERFTETHGSFIPKASIRQNATIGLNDAAVRKYGFKPGTHVVLFYDKDTQTIGFSPVDRPGMKGAIKLSFGTKGATISARSFLSYYGIDHGSTRKALIETREGHPRFVFSAAVTPEKSKKRAPVVENAEEKDQTAGEEDDDLPF